MRTATYNVDAASDRRRRENVPGRIHSLKNWKTSSAILKEVKNKSRLAVSVDSDNGDHYNFNYYGSGKSLDFIAGIDTNLRSWGLFWRRKKQCTNMKSWILIRL